MKKTFLLFPLAIMFLFFVARCDAKNDDGIKFQEDNWKQVLSKAKSEHKLIFLDIYASWCGPCKMLKRQTFTDKTAADYFNTTFVNASFDGEKGDGPMLAEKYKISAYPSLFILDENGNVVKSTVGFIPASELINFGKSAQKK